MLLFHSFCKVRDSKCQQINNAREDALYFFLHYVYSSPRFKRFHEKGQDLMLVSGLVVALLCAVVWCFTPSEVEIFELHNALISKYGEEIDFYKFLKLPKLRDSTSKEIIKNFRKLSKKYHPDKNSKYKKLYSRLNIATKILTDDSSRKTYDYYLKHGFPDYDFRKGGFFFKRVQPKTWFLLLFVYIAASVIHYVLLKIQAQGQRKRIEFFIHQSKEQDDTRGLGEKKLVFKQHDADEPKTILIRYGDVFVIEPTGEESLISPDSVPQVSIFDCLFFRIPKSILKLIFGSSKKRDEQQVKQRSDASEIKQAKNEVKEPKVIKQSQNNSKKENQMILPNGKILKSRKKK